MNRLMTRGFKCCGLVLSSGWLLATAGCLPENYFGNLVSTLSVSAANLVVSTFITDALITAGLITTTTTM